MAGRPSSTDLWRAHSGVFQLHKNGQIYMWTGGKCSSPSACPPWAELDNNPATVAVAAGGRSLYQMHRDGSVFESTMQPCTASGTVCTGWSPMGTAVPTTAITASSLYVFRLLRTGSIWKGSSAGWQEIDGNPLTVQISASNGT